MHTAALGAGGPRADAAVRALAASFPSTTLRVLGSLGGHHSTDQSIHQPTDGSIFIWPISGLVKFIIKTTTSFPALLFMAIQENNSDYKGFLLTQLCLALL